MARKRGELGKAIRAMRLRKQSNPQNAPGDAPPAASDETGSVEAAPAAPHGEPTGAAGQPHATHATRGHARTHRGDERKHR